MVRGVISKTMKEVQTFASDCKAMGKLVPEFCQQSLGDVLEYHCLKTGLLNLDLWLMPWLLKGRFIFPLYATGFSMLSQPEPI